MKKLFFISVLIFFFGDVKAQTWAPIGATWTFGIGNSFDSTVQFNQWISIGDTLINGHNCSVIKRFGVKVYNWDVYDSLFTYEDSNRVYCYNFTTHLFTTFYDFNKNAGDSWTTKMDSCDLLIHVDSTSTTTINGHLLNTQYISTIANTFVGPIIEHIGSIHMPMPPYWQSCNGLVVDDLYYLGLRCYEDSIIGFHSFNIAPYCNYVSVKDIYKENTLTLFPNPVHETVSINKANIEPNQIRVVDALGRSMSVSITTNNNQTQINTSLLPPGLYIVLLNDGNTVLSAKMMKE